MQNLNKFTKHELINKIKKLDNQNNNQGHNQSYLHKIVNSILLFKSLILKITLIALLIRWFKKYSLVTKFWHFFRWIASGLLGISLIDIYSLDIISWIKDSSIYKWYSDLLYAKEVITQVKDNKSSEFPKRITNQTNENETTNSRISEWVTRNNQSKEIENHNDSIWDKIQTNSKTIAIVTGVIIISGLSYYYFDEIKDGFSNGIQWIKDHLSKPPTNPNADPNASGNLPNQTNSGQNNQVIEKEIDNKANIIERSGYFKDDDAPIELIDKGKNKASEISSSSKSNLTSPSLESLNNKVEESWSESKFLDSSETSGSNSPKSITSDETIIGTSFIGINSLNWFNLLDQNQINKIKLIEEICKHYGPLTVENQDLIRNIIIDLIRNYDIYVKIYDSLTDNDKIKMTTNLFYFRTWIAKYFNIINPHTEINTIIGNITDKPTFIKDVILKINED